MNTQEQLIEIVESAVIKYIQRLLKEAGQDVDEQEAKNVLGHIAKKMIIEANS